MSNTSTLGKHNEDSTFLHHEACPKCGSRDNLSRYSSGWGICSCGYKDKPTDTVSTYQETTSSPTTLLQGTVSALSKRGITEETCRKFNYQVGKDSKGRVCQIAPYYSGRTLVAQKIRYSDKTFKFLGKAKDVDLFGQHLWAGSGKMVVITEGEIDCLTVSQLQGNKWPVVSLPNGCSAAPKVIKKSLEWLETFESVILMFDMDEPGQEAVEACVELFTPGKCKVATLPYKDANECLLAGASAAVVNAIWQAKVYRPEGLLDIDDIRDQALLEVPQGLPWCFPELTEATYGRRYGEIYGVGAGTGCGKTDFLTQQIAYDVDTLQQHVGVIFLEQKPVETAKRIAGKLSGRRFHIPNPQLPSEPYWTTEELQAGIERLNGKVTFFDAWGSTDWTIVASKIRYMAISQGIRIFYLDHLTAMADTSDERGSLEQIMKELAGLANELDVMITFVSHLSTPEGKPHEEGGRVMIRHFKGARAIGFWSYFMFGLERNTQQPTNPTIFRILKDRNTGQSVGTVITLGYCKETGLLSVQELEPESSRYFSEDEEDQF